MKQKQCPDCLGYLDARTAMHLKPDGKTPCMPKELASEPPIDNTPEALVHILIDLRVKMLAYAATDLSYASRASAHEALKNIEAALKEFGWDPEPTPEPAPPAPPRTTIRPSEVDHFRRTGRLKK